MPLVAGAEALLLRRALRAPLRREEVHAVEPGARQGVGGMKLTASAQAGAKFGFKRVVRAHGVVLEHQDLRELRLRPGVARTDRARDRQIAIREAGLTIAE